MFDASRQVVVVVKLSLYCVVTYLCPFDINIAIVYFSSECNLLLEIIFPALDIVLIDSPEICDWQYLFWNNCSNI